MEFSNNDEPIFRQATAADCAALTALMLRSRAYEGRYRSMIERYPVSPEMVRRGEVWICELRAEIVGFYRLNIAEADLDLMFVDNRAQGQGIGKKLFDHMKSFAASNGLSDVGIVAHPPAANFYRRMGANDAGVSKAKSPDGWDRPMLKLAVSR